jgi:hypothetical protein
MPNIESAPRLRRVLSALAGCGSVLIQLVLAFGFCLFAASAISQELVPQAAASATPVPSVVSLNSL